MRAYGIKERKRVLTAVSRQTAFLLWAALLMSGCAGTDCLENRSSLPLAGFYGVTPGDAPGAEARSVSVSLLTVYGIGAPGDSLLYESATLSEAWLPFRLDIDSTSYVFRYMAYAPSGDDTAAPGEDAAESPREAASPLPVEQIPADTVTFRYVRRPWFADVACGAMYNFEVTGIEHTGFAIDSVVCPKGVITNLPEENLRIYFRMEQEDPDDEEQ